MKNKEIWYDKNGAEAFERDVLEELQRCNELADLAEAFQPWQKITSIEDWRDLATDPAGWFDAVLLSNVTLSTGGRQADPEALARLISIERDNYLNAVAGKPVADGCVPCQKTKFRKGSMAISLNQFNQYKDFLIFDEGRFHLNRDTIKRHKETFKVVLNTDIKVNYYSHYQDMARILNEHIEVAKLGTESINHLSKICDLQLLNGKLIVNDMKLAQTIKHLI
jgi:hypothetical protein